jgi:flavin-dependent dehydrogenase
MGLPYSKVCYNALTGTDVHLPNGSVLKIRAKQVMAYVFDRAKYDVLAADAAKKAGAKIILGKKPKISGLKGAIIGADGVTSDVAREFRFPPIRKYVFCYQEDLENASVPDAEIVDVFVCNAILPGFFAWAIPLGKDRVRLGCGVGEHANAKLALEKLIKKEKILQNMLDGSRKFDALGGVIPMHIREKTVKGRVMLVGDAAGQAKPTTGGGIYFGSMCGRIAGEVAANAKKESELLQYEKKWRQLYERDLVLNRRIRELSNKLGDGEICAYAGIAKTLGIEGFLSNFGDMDSPTRMLGHVKKSPVLAKVYSAFASKLRLV